MEENIQPELKQNNGKAISPNPIQSDEKKIPIASGQHLMSFPDAISAINDGKKITKIEWNNKEDYGLLRAGYLHIHTSKDNQFHIWKVSQEDLFGEDYIVIE